MGGTHTAPSGAQTGPMVAEAKAMWDRFLKAALYCTIFVIGVLVFLAVFVA